MAFGGAKSTIKAVAGFEAGVRLRRGVGLPSAAVYSP
jgi:hypothetical protein